MSPRAGLRLISDAEAEARERPAAEAAETADAAEAAEAADGAREGARGGKGGKGEGRDCRLAARTSAASIVGGSGYMAAAISAAASRAGLTVRACGMGEGLSDAGKPTECVESSPVPGADPPPPPPPAPPSLLRGRFLAPGGEGEGGDGRP